MTETSELRTVVVERDIPHPADKIWRALTQPHLISEWLMDSDFAPELGHSFRFTADWGAVDCKVFELDPPRTLAYSWDAFGLESTVTFTLTPSDSGTLLRVEQSGFRRDQAQAYAGSKASWPGFLEKLEQVVAGLD